MMNNFKTKLELRAWLEKLFLHNHANQKNEAIASFKEAIQLDPEIKIRARQIIQENGDFLNNIRNEVEFLELLED